MDKYLNTIAYGPNVASLSQLGFYSYIKGQRLSKLLHETELTVGSINYWHTKCSELELDNLVQFCESCDIVFLVSDETTTRKDCDHPWSTIKQLLDRHNVYYIMFSDRPSSYTSDLKHFVMPWFVKQKLLLPSEDNMQYEPKQYVFNCLLGSDKLHRTEIYNAVKHNAQIYTTYFGHAEHKHASAKHLESEHVVNHLYHQPVHQQKLNTYNNQGSFSIYPGEYHFSHIVPIGVYSQTHFDIVSETSLLHNEHFVTEKTAKPLAMGRYFVHYSSPNTVSYMEKYGFDFTDYDMSYDSIEDNSHRMSALLSWIDGVCVSDVEHIYNKSKENRLFNQHQYQQLCNKFWGGLEQFIAQAVLQNNQK